MDRLAREGGCELIKNQRFYLLKYEHQDKQYILSSELGK